jgi:redox-sensing transcriptional repressor
MVAVLRRGPLSAGRAGVAIGATPSNVMNRAKQKHENGDPRDVPKAVVSRLSLYLRELRHLLKAGKSTVSSSELGSVLGFTDAQVRKDLAYFGHFGHPGIGYRCEELVAAIRTILGTDKQWTVAMVGVGNLGRALLGYRGFAAQGFRIVAAFDIDPHKSGVEIEGVPVHHLNRLDEIVRDQEVQLGLISVPAAAAQSVAEQLVRAGIVGIVNFAPVTLSLPEEVGIVGVDLVTELEQLTFSVANRAATR